MPKPLGSFTTREFPEGHISVLVIAHREGISAEGAQEWHQRAKNAIGHSGLEVVGDAMGWGDPQAEAEKVVRAVWA